VVAAALVKVTISHLVKRFGDTVAVNDVSLEIEDKESISFLGPSGSGKTTLLRCIAGLESPESGDIYIGDTLVNDLSPKERDIAMVFQNYGLYPHMSVYENIAFPLKMRKLARQDIDRKVKEVAELLRITHLLSRKPKQTSGGEAQRTALGRAIVRDPKVFLMDEPLSNLDAKLRIYMRAEIKRLHRELGVTTIYVTHDQAEAMTIADRIAVMNNGSIQQVGTSEILYNRPANAFVAGFIGNPPMNTINCGLKTKDNHAFLDFGVATYKIDSIRGVIGQANENQEVILGIRPEHIRISATKSEGMELEVFEVEPLGSEVIVNLRMGDNLIKVKTNQTHLKMGQKAWITFDEDKIHLFDKSGAKAII
jgi:multiple sugar transport system ATP-binding protein